jgi:hypothetical protein
LCQLPADLHAVRYTATLIVGRYAFWLSARPDMLVPLLQYVVQGLNHKSTQPAAALAAPAAALTLADALALPSARAVAVRIGRTPGKAAAEAASVAAITLASASATLRPAAVAAALDSAVTGVFAAWARLGAGPVFPAATSIGFNPHFGDTPARTVEPWILAPPGALPTEFYGERLRLLVVAYIRPEAAFDGLDSLIARIHADAAVSRAALAHPTLAGTAADPRLVGE